MERCHLTSLTCALVMIALTCTGCLGDQKSFDCKMRQLGLDFANKIQPFRSKAHFQKIADALNGAQEAQNCSVSISARHGRGHTNLLRQLRQKSCHTCDESKRFYVDGLKGNDTNTGSVDSPLKTMTRALTLTRLAGHYSTIVLRKGTFYLTETVELDSRDKGLTIQNYQTEEVWISGGRVITPTWEKYDVDPSKDINIYQADMSLYGLGEISGLRIDTKRGIRARYPNADPEMGFGSRLVAEKWLPPSHPPQPDYEVNPDDPLRNSSVSFKHFQLGIGGTCSNFDPPAGYWCGNHTEGGGAFTYRIPSGMIAGRETLPNSPYKNANGAIVHAWRPSHWASWMFEVDDYDRTTGTFKFGRGGFQGARGSDKGAEIVVENVMEELDAPTEWFYDKDKKMLYYFHNATPGVEPPRDTLFVVTQLKTLISIKGSQSELVEDVMIHGVNFRDAAYTYMDPHGMPSGGDWGLQRMGALFLEGTENVTIDNCIFERLDGNAIMVSGYNRNTTIQRNEFLWIGDTAIAQWGYTSGTDVPGMGWDGTDGNQPRYSRILHNFAHELGIWEKQSAFYFQAKSCQNLIRGNVFFNGPRAGINFNDGFGGGNNVSENFLFNTCRESGDHGPFNSWDRQVFVTQVLDGTPQTQKDWDYISSNFIIANYNSQEAIDNDDGSNYYKTFRNFFAYSGNGMKNDFGGHDNWHFHNIYAYVGRGFGVVPQLPGHADYFFGNEVIMNKDGDYGLAQVCNDIPGVVPKTVVHDNHIYTPNGNVTECGMSLAEWQAKGNDPGTTANKWPDDDELVKMIQKLLTLVDL